jgi:uncharacterized Zn finger protein
MYRYFGDWEQTGPRAVKDGIRAQSRGGSFAASWWGKRWLQTLEGFGWDSRLQRGRSYARRGQVVDLKLGPGGVTAGVQGSQPKPYRVKIQVQPLADGQWERAVAALEERPLFIGQLLAGEMPAEIEDVFREAEAALFPAESEDLEMSCSCPDWAVPCKHLAAVYYLLAEWLDRDPFLLFELRGRDREALLAALRERRGTDDAPDETAAEPEEPLSAEGFWSGGAVELGPENEAPPAVPQALLRALGEPPGWNETPLLGALRPLYAAVSGRAETVLRGDETAAPE